MATTSPLTLLPFLALLPAASTAAASYGEGVWPELGTLPASGLGARDAAVVVGIEHYEHYGDLRGATKAAHQWAQWLERTHGVSADRLTVLTDDDASCAEIRRAAQAGTSQVEAGGTLWVVFVGRGSLAPSGSDALLLGANADPGAESQGAMGLALSGLVEALGRGDQKRSLLVLDTAFEPPPAVPGQAMEPKVIQPGPAFHVRGNTTALLASNTGHPLPWLPDLRQPAFSYLLLGALRGWGDADDNKRVTALEALDYTRQAMAVFHPEYAEAPAGWGPLEGNSISAAGEFAPDLADVSWRAAERRVSTRIHELNESEQMLRGDASAVWQAVLGAYGMGGQDAMASVDTFLDRWSVSSVKVDHMTRWLVVPEIEDARALQQVVQIHSHGSDPVRTVEGERYVQLQEEISQFLRRNAWKGVEASYAEMLLLAELGVTVQAEDHLHGARAARQLGDAMAVRERLLRAVEVGPNEEVVQWLNDLEHNYGRVSIQIQRRDGVALEPKAMPFAPDRRAAVLFVQEQLEDHGTFDGLLPAGVYHIGEELLVVVPGDPPLGLTVQKARRSGRD